MCLAANPHEDDTPEPPRESFEDRIKRHCNWLFNRRLDPLAAFLPPALPVDQPPRGFKFRTVVMGVHLFDLNPNDPDFYKAAYARMWKRRDHALMLWRENPNAETEAQYWQRISKRSQAPKKGNRRMGKAWQDGQAPLVPNAGEALLRASSGRQESGQGAEQSPW